MLTLIIKSYFIILLSIGLISILLFIVGLYLIFKKPTENKPCVKESEPASPQLPLMQKSDADNTYYLLEIAGDDLIATQLDLARAYIETGKNSLARTILDPIIAQGNEVQQQEAIRLKSII